MDDSRLSAEMSDLTKAIYELKSEIALLKHRMLQLEQAMERPRPLLQTQQVNLIVGALVVIAVLIGYGLYVGATGG